MSLQTILEESKQIVFDTGVFIAYFMGESDTLCSLMDQFVFTEHPTVDVIGHDVLLTEVFYIICRSGGRDRALENMYKMKAIITIVDTQALIENAGWIKCKYSISLPDCFSIATAMLKACPVCFLEESELSTMIVERIKNETGTSIHILDFGHEKDVEEAQG